MGYVFPSGDSALRSSADRWMHSLGAGYSFLSRTFGSVERYAVKTSRTTGARCILGLVGHLEERSGGLSSPYRKPHQEPKARSLWHGRRRQVREFGKMDSELREKGCLGFLQESEVFGRRDLRVFSAGHSFECTWGSRSRWSGRSDCLIKTQQCERVWL